MSKLTISLDQITKPLMKKYGFYHNKIINDWHLIVGSDLADTTFPAKLANYKYRGKLENVLYINVSNSGTATEIIYKEQMILEKIALYLGYRAVDKIKIIQNPIFYREKEEVEKKVKLSSDQLELLQNLTQDIEDDELRKALQNLGSYIYGSYSK